MRRGTSLQREHEPREDESRPILQGPIDQETVAEMSFEEFIALFDE